MSHSITIKELFVSYHGNPVIQDVSFEVEQGKLVGIIGPNGAGKSTLIKAILELIPHDKGSIKVNGSAIRTNRKMVAYVPQRNNIDWDFPITVLDVVLLGTFPHLGFFRKPKKNEKLFAMECLKKVGMESFKNRQIGELSGGQQQRVFLARALAQNTDILFLDEPFVGIDMTSEDTIIKILKELRNAGKTIIVVHHDLTKAQTYFDELLLLNQRLIHYGSVEEVLNPTIISKAYTNHPFYSVERDKVNLI
ncbi:MULTISPECIES: metal ABC transporter ATP-binding protein [unclassified Bacillus (in: firmicutes)]|uniref:metal ABC transporter ATP-binding protein n=1 Tax=unclassified Bacillus (in: firmicutes) TaxID=185979 RepID=UPI000BF07450|nr:MULTISPECIES: metal ABC transporter ATP-binding protein [unclassified Bacillus (in: firmicutes)]PEJ56278.1 manganese transporter [Bacillus sp. AFS002410]PEL10510.1 manganese transporter [Bacillus sp. AFS017336]